MPAASCRPARRTSSMSDPPRASSPTSSASPISWRPTPGAGWRCGPRRSRSTPSVPTRPLFAAVPSLAAWFSSLPFPATSTFGALLLGYPMAYAIARAAPRRRPLLLMLVVLPFWTSFLIRVYAWMGLLAENGILNQFLRWTGLVPHPGTILGTEWAVHLGIVYAYLPFMGLPLYATLEQLDWSLLEAAADLRAKPIAP